MSAPALLTVAEVADRLAVSPDTVRRWIKAGTLDVFQIGRVVRVPESSVVALIKRRTTPARDASLRRATRATKGAARPAVSRPSQRTPLAVLANLRAAKGEGD
jgi:excisionase family DNA binding protein